MARKKSMAIFKEKYKPKTERKSALDKLAEEDKKKESTGGIETKSKDVLAAEAQLSNVEACKKILSISGYVKPTHDIEECLAPGGGHILPFP